MFKVKKKSFLADPAIELSEKTQVALIRAPMQLLLLYLTVIFTSITHANGNTYCWKDFTNNNVVRFQGNNHL